MTSEEIALAVVNALESLGVPYIIVGSLASNYYGVPRATQDADFLIQLGDIRVSSVVKRLGSDFQLDPQTSFEPVTGTIRHVVRSMPVPFHVEFFLLSEDPHDQERFRRRRRGSPA